jgi:antitoxin (DNA-binding transcriptional repressor) of toxin-antitoxin stability system
MNSLDQTGAVSFRGAPRATKQPARTITQRPQIVSQALAISMTRHYLLVNLVKFGRRAGAAMTDTVNLYDAKTNLSKLVDRADEEIVIAKGDEPTAKLVPAPGWETASVWAEPARNHVHCRRFRQHPAARNTEIFRVGRVRFRSTRISCGGRISGPAGSCRGCAWRCVMRRARLSKRKVRAPSVRFTPLGSMLASVAGAIRKSIELGREAQEKRIDKS